VHQTLRVTPAIEAGLATYVWSIDEIVGLLDRRILSSGLSTGCHDEEDFREH
jgi:hypothetical protein